MKRYLILGGGVSGISAASAIRENDAAAEISIVADEKAGPYYRPLIPLLVSGRMSESEIKYPENPLQGKNVRLIHETAEKVDPKNKEVLLSSGNRLRFDALLLATGGIPAKPPIPGLDGQGVYFPRSLDQAIALRQAARGARNVVVIGGGLVGIKIALALREQSLPAGKPPLEVTVVEFLPEIINRALDRRGAAMIRAAVVKKGVAVLTGQTVSEIIRSPSAIKGVKLASGTILPADLLVVAAGVKPNIDFLERSGIRRSTGILVDEYLQTNISGIFAAGDVAEGMNLLTGARAVNGLWADALEMGRVAGTNMAGGKVRYPGFLPVMNASDIADIPFISAGIVEPEGNGFKTIVHEDASSYRKLVIDDEFLVGAVFVGNLEKAGRYVNLIKNRIPVSMLGNRRSGV
jgi:nitrite reductase (NADH) large subunit